MGEYLTHKIMKMAIRKKNDERVLKEMFKKMIL